MKVKKLIKKLENIKKVYGNLDVHIELSDYDVLYDGTTSYDNYEEYAGEKIGICPDFDDGIIRIQSDVTSST